jgi:acyl-coenzyme A synthetase/AMP-(fatty) acid ligase
VAFVVRSEADPPTLDELRAHAKAHLPAYAAPRAVEVVSELPRTSLGKVARRDLT